MNAAGQITTPWRYLQELWSLRFFLLSLVRKDIESRYRYSFLGIGWSLARPLAMSALFCFLFSRLFQLPIDEYAPYVILGMAVWGFLVESTILGSMTFKQAAGYIRQRPMPLALFPLRTVLAVSFHASISLGIALVVTLLFRGFRGFPDISLLSILPAFLCLLVFGWSIATIAGLLSCYFPDVQHVLDIVLQFLFYLTPILYPLELVASQGQLFSLLNLNPLAHLLNLVREPMLHGRAAPLVSYLVAAALVGGMFLLASLLLKKLGKRIIFWVY